MGIRIYNSLTNRDEDFVPLQAGRVGMYLCGPTVYKPSHIGHAVGPVIFDAIKRYLKYRGYEVTWVVNITDVEDKLIAEAKSKGISVPELAAQVTRNYFDAMDALSVTGIDQFPKASEHIGDIIDIIRRLVDRGAAYVSDGDVYFDVTADEDYGKLSNRKTEDQSGQRDLQGGNKRNAGDFALWKAAKTEEPDDVKWDSPWGKGRPGWHIECSAMSMKLLGETFDIHGGGLDLIFPHHENEIAQSETCTGKPFSKYWMHHGLTRFNTKKVSKSDPEMQAALAQMTLGTLLEKYSGELLRYFILSTHYRRPIEYSPEEIESKRKGLNTFYRLFERVEGLSSHSVYEGVTDDPTPKMSDESDGPVTTLAEAVSDAGERFCTAMDADFNTAVAIAVLFDLANAINRFIEQVDLESSRNRRHAADALAATRLLIGLGRLLGLFLAPPAKALGGDALIESVLQLHMEIREACRKDKNFALADLIRDRLGAAGVSVEDTPGGSGWRMDSVNGSGDLIDELLRLHVDVRQAARAAKAYSLADRVRNGLHESGVMLEDRPGGTVWHIEGTNQE